MTKEVTPHEIVAMIREMYEEEVRTRKTVEGRYEAELMLALMPNLVAFLEISAPNILMEHNRDESEPEMRQLSVQAIVTMAARMVVTHMVNMGYELDDKFIAAMSYGMVTSLKTAVAEAQEAFEKGELVMVTRPTQH